MFFISSGLRLQSISLVLLFRFLRLIEVQPRCQNLIHFMLIWVYCVSTLQTCGFMMGNRMFMFAEMFVFDVRSSVTVIFSKDSFLVSVSFEDISFLLSFIAFSSAFFSFTLFSISLVVFFFNFYFTHQICLTIWFLKAFSSNLFCYSYSVQLFPSFMGLISFFRWSTTSWFSFTF